MRLKNMIEAAAGFFAVRKCAVCGKVLSDEERGAFCSACEEKYRALKDEVCTVCGRTSAYCRCACVGDFHDIGAGRVLHLFFYDGDFSRRVIYALKNGGKARLIKALAHELAELIYLSKGSDDISAYTVTYVPRSRRNIKKYGFDQAKMMAKYIARELDIPFACTLVRIGSSSQKAASAEERRERAERSYALADLDIAGRKFIIIDDVITSGSTLHACISLLREAGASQIIAATAAKTQYSAESYDETDADMRGEYIFPMGY